MASSKACCARLRAESRPPPSGSAFSSSDVYVADKPVFRTLVASSCEEDAGVGVHTFVAGAATPALAIETALSKFVVCILSAGSCRDI
jgi:hypothetical protein